MYVKNPPPPIRLDSCDMVVFSLFGVILIARPQSLFGKHSSDNGVKYGIDTNAPIQRIIAVG